jgi:hypothetical protein
MKELCVFVRGMFSAYMLGHKGSYVNTCVVVTTTGLPKRAIKEGLVLIDGKSKVAKYCNHVVGVLAREDDIISVNVNFTTGSH